MVCRNSNFYATLAAQYEKTNILSDINNYTCAFVRHAVGICPEESRAQVEFAQI